MVPLGYTLGGENPVVDLDLVDETVEHSIAVLDGERRLDRTEDDRDDDRLDGGDGVDTVRGSGGSDKLLDELNEVDESFAYWAEWVDAV